VATVSLVAASTATLAAITAVRTLTRLFRSESLLVADSYRCFVLYWSLAGLLASCRLSVATATAATTTTPAAIAVSAGSAFADLVSICGARNSFKQLFFCRRYGWCKLRLGSARTFIATIAAAISTISASAILRARRAIGGLKVCRIARFFHKVGDVKERVALETDVYKAGLHSGKDASDTSVVDRAGECVFVFPLVVDLCKFVLLDDGKPRFVRCA
jgi:hypothetical protein